jgi:hypothetical protein
VARVGKGNTVTDEPVEIVDHSETLTDEQAWDNSPTNYAAETEVPGMTTDVNDLTGLPPAETVPELPEHDAEATGAKTRRGRPKLGDLPELKYDDLLVDEDVPEDEWAAMPSGSTPAATERSEIQLKFDNDVKAVHNAWVEAGKPAAKLSPRKRYVVKPEMDNTTRAMLTRAGTINKLRVIIILKSHTPDGKVSIVYTVHDRPPSVKKSDKK